MRWVITAVLFLLTLTVETAAGGHFTRLLDAAPNLAVILIVQLTLVAPRFEAVVGAWVMGLVADLHGDAPVGVFAFAWALTALALSRMRSDLFAEHLLTRLLLVAAAATLQESAVAISAVLRGHAPHFLFFLKHTSLVTVYTVLAALVLLPVFRLVLRRVFTVRRDV